MAMQGYAYRDASLCRSHHVEQDTGLHIAEHSDLPRSEAGAHVYLTAVGIQDQSLISAESLRR